MRFHAFQLFSDREGIDLSKPLNYFNKNGVNGVPYAPDSSVKADKATYLRQHANLRHSLLCERPSNEILRQLATRADAKYLLIRVRHRRLKTLSPGKLNGLVQEMESKIAKGSCPSRSDFEDLIAGSPMDAFSVARLHNAVKDEVLAGTQAETTLEIFDLRKGLPLKSVVPAVRVFDGKVFDALQASCKNIRTLAEIVADQEGVNVKMAEGTIQRLRQGYHRGGTEPGRYRITTRHAAALHRALTTAAQGWVLVPKLDDLFPHDPAKWPIGSKLGTKPLGTIDGALF